MQRNLKRALIVIGGVDEKSVAEMLDQEGL